MDQNSHALELICHLIFQQYISHLKYSSTRALCHSIGEFPPIHSLFFNTLLFWTFQCHFVNGTSMIPHHTCHARASASPFYAPVTTVPTLPPRHCYRLLPHSATTTATTTIAKTKSRQLVIVAATDFHQKRLAANPSPLSSPSSSLLSLSPPSLVIRLAERDDELEASAWLRARSFYAYPPERKFAGEVRFFLSSLLSSFHQHPLTYVSHLQSPQVDPSNDGSRRRI